MPDSDLAIGQKPRIASVNELTFSECMEQLQEAYVAGVAATNGCLYNPLMRDAYGFDALIVQKRPSQFQELSLYVQLKCTTVVKPDTNSEFFSFRLKKREYFERLAVRRTPPKAILLVMATSPDQATWTSGDHDSLSILHACYWVSLEGLPVPDSGQPTVRVPIKNRFDAPALESILQTLDQGGDLRDGLA
ncbi:MAG TPA: DUF4365 domain-containing protein [Candidatus Limnocylindrales bacterium]|nr:DUF4365 domain-containing protein [Candidatus Limnocylindrales bacterium]